MNFENYLSAIEKALKLGNATEHTHRPALKTLVESFGKVVATNEPKRIDCGAPDYIVAKANAASTPVGYVEAKDVGKDLSVVEASSQLKRYRASLRNLVLTDYLAFRLYRDGELVATAKFLARRVTPSPERSGLWPALSRPIGDQRTTRVAANTSVLVTKSSITVRPTHQSPRLFTWARTVESACSFCACIRASFGACTGGIGNPATSWVRLSTCSTKLVRGTNT